MIEITEEFLTSGMSERGGWNKKQLAILGVAWPPKKGWKSRLLSTFINQNGAQAFLAAKKMYWVDTIKNQRKTPQP